MRDNVLDSAWLLDLYPDPEGTGCRAVYLTPKGPVTLHHNFAVTFYAAGSTRQIRTLEKHLSSRGLEAECQRTYRRHLFQGDIPVAAITYSDAPALSDIFFHIQRRFPDLSYYDADIPLMLRYAAIYGVTPLVRCRVVYTDDLQVVALEPRDDPWDPKGEPPRLRIVRLRPDVNPERRVPQFLYVQCGKRVHRIPLSPRRPFLIRLNALFRQHDPDLVLTHWGDTWLFPLLAAWDAEQGLPGFNPNRDPDCEPDYRTPHSYETYGRVEYRGAQAYLFGRVHIDERNAMMYGDYGLDGILELSRVTGLSIQEAARRSPGAGITALQIITALRKNILVPFHKTQAEHFKTVKQLIVADRGGLVAQPIPGLHQDVAEIDFISMYPSIMCHFNLSPETVGIKGQTNAVIPELDIPVDRSYLGFVPETLQPLLAKRIAIKKQLATLHPRDSRYGALKARSGALKWLLVVCFGYLGYKNARFGRVEAHEAVTAYGRECLLRAKEAAEESGYRVLHMYVDGLWIQRRGISKNNVAPLLEEISRRTGLPIALEGIYRWIAFLPSRMDERVSVANRYFGVFEGGKIKYRGIEIRRGDTCLWVAKVQEVLLTLLATLSSPAEFTTLLPDIIPLLRREVRALQHTQIPIDQLVVTQRLSRDLNDYKTPSAAARAAAQLLTVGKASHPGQRIRFVYSKGQPGVYAWDLPLDPDPCIVDTDRYFTLLMRAAHAVLGPFGVKEKTLEIWSRGSTPKMLSITAQPQLWNWHDAGTADVVFNR